MKSVRIKDLSQPLMMTNKESERSEQQKVSPKFGKIFS